MVPGRRRNITQEVAIFGVDTQQCRKFLNKQWWPVVWANTVFYLWTHWTAMVYGGKPLGDPNSTLCKVWDAVLVDGQALLQRSPGVFSRKHWEEAGFYNSRYRSSWSHRCVWVSGGSSWSRDSDDD